MNPVEERITTADLAKQAQTKTPPPPKPAMEEQTGPLLPSDFTGELRSRWDKIQAGFVDEPRTAVQHADELVAQAMKQIAESFSAERTKLEQQWDRGDDVNTEDLRQALRKYRAFFQRLLSV